MHTIELLLHSYFRWIVVFTFIINLIFIYHGYYTNRVYSKYDLYLTNISLSFIHIQLLLGIILFYKSPIVETFFENTEVYMKISELRFFAIEHSTTMLFAIVLLTIGFSLAKRKNTSNTKFKTLMIFYTISFILILISIPWEFSPFIQRPSFR